MLEQQLINTFRFPPRIRTESKYIYKIYRTYYLIECLLKCYCFLHTLQTKLINNPSSSTFRSLDDLTSRVNKFISFENKEQNE